MTRSRELLNHVQQLQDVRNILNSMKNLALMEAGKLSRFLQVQRQVVEQIHSVAYDFLDFHPWPEFSGDRMARVALLIGSERGFCGAFNEALLAELASAEQDEVIAVGRKLGQSLVNCPCKARILGGPNVAEDIPESLNRLITTVTEIQRQQAPVQLTVLHHHWETTGVIRRQLLPPFRQGRKNRQAHISPPVLNLQPEVFLQELVDHYLFAVLHEVFYTSLMAENRQRLQHMEGAVRHLDERCERLRRKAQTFRQEEITEEIEVILLTAESLY